MKKKIYRSFLSLILTISLLSGFAIPAFAQLSDVQPERAGYYVLIPGKEKYRLNPDPQFYKKIGNGYIDPAVGVQADSEDVSVYFTELPDYGSLGLTGSQTINWYRTVYNKSWYVYGEIVGEPDAEEQEQEQEQEADNQDGQVDQVEEVAVQPERAGYYVLTPGKEAYRSNVDPQFYTKIGNGYIDPTVGVQTDAEDISVYFTEVPDYESLGLTGSQTINWYRTVFSKSWYVYGEIVGDPNAVSESADRESPTAEEEIVVETAAAGYYVLIPGKESYRSNVDPQFYKKIGNGTVMKSTEAQMDTDNLEDFLVGVPSADSLGLAENQTIHWYRAFYSKSWYIYGEIVNSPDSKEPVDSIEVPGADVSQTPLKEPETFREFMFYWLITGDTEVHDISKYGFAYAAMDAEYKAMLADEGLEARECLPSLLVQTTSSNKIVQTVKYTGIDDGFLDRYAKMQASISEIMEGISPQMSDIDKILHVHQYIINTTRYLKVDLLSHMAAGPLSLKAAVCQGYAHALNLLATKMGIETYYASSPKMDHGWPMVKLDGNWYHIDPTWDDTRSPVNGQVGRSFFLRSDVSFKTDPVSRNQHSGWDESSFNPAPKASSTKYDNWFIHDVTGTMYYHNGLWYFIYKGDLVRSTLDGKNQGTLTKGSDGAITLVGVDGGMLTYRQGGKEISIDIGDIVPLSNSPFADSLKESPVIIWAIVIVALLALAAVGYFFYKKRFAPVFSDSVE